MTGETGGDKPPEAEHFCKEHKMIFFKRGTMRSYAHPIGDTGTWCNEPKAKSEVKPGDTPTIRDIAADVARISQITAAAALFNQDEQVEPLISSIDPVWFQEQLTALQARGFKNWSNDNVLSRLNTMTGAQDKDFPAALGKLTQEQAVKIVARIDGALKA